MPFYVTHDDGTRTQVSLSQFTAGFATTVRGDLPRRRNRIERLHDQSYHVRYELERLIRRFQGLTEEVGRAR